MVTLILIRHCLTDDNLNKRYCGFRDVGLNQIGRVQARKIKNKLKRIKIDKVFCSDLRRSLQTAKIIFQDQESEIIKNRELREINFGKWEGMKFKQILHKYPSIYQMWLRDPFRADIPGGEKIVNFVARVRKEFKDIVSSHPNQTVAVVSHCGPLRVILNSILKIKDRDFWKLRLDPRLIYIIKVPLLRP